MAEIKVGEARSVYDRLAVRREPFLERARTAARLTIPSLMPPEGHTRTSDLPAPYQGIGARGLSNLASKLLLSLFPPNAPFMRFKVDEFQQGLIDQIEDAKSEIEQSLARLEKGIMDELERMGFRIHASESFEQLVGAGNVLVYISDQSQVRNFLLNQYVVDRDPMGNLEAIVIKEMVNPEVLRARGVAIENPEDPSQGFSPDQELEVYTAIYRTKKNTFKVHQEYDSELIPNSQGKYQEENLPWIPLRFEKLANESYGRGLVEKYEGPLKAAEGLSRAILDGAAASARIIALVSPNSSINVQDLNDAENGEAIKGEEGDVTFLQVQKHADLGVARATLESIESTLGAAFLLNSSLIRHSERTTAEEVRFTAQELEDTLGGVYSVLGLEFQLPVVKRIMAIMKRQRRFPALPKSVSPTIITGLEALGRSHDLNRLDLFIAGAVQTFGEAVLSHMNVGDYLTRRATASGIDPSGLIKSEEQVQQERQQQQLAEAAQAAAPNIARGAIEAAQAQPQES